MLIANGNAGDLITEPEVEDIVNPPVVVPNTFTSGQTVYRRPDNTWALAQNDNLETLGMFIIKEASPAMFKLAKPTDVIEGFTGLVPGDAMHVSPTVPGELVPVAQGDEGPTDAVASNALAFALTPTSIIVKDITPFLLAQPVDDFSSTTTTMDSSTVTFDSTL